MSGLMTEKIANWILVTGMIRSGTTFVGRILSVPLQIDYIHEPFNNGYTLPGREPFSPRYVSPHDPDVNHYREQLAHLFRYDFGLQTTKNRRDPWWRKIAKMCVGSRGPFYLRLAKINPLHRAAIIKDPLATRTAEYLYHEFGVRPVIVVRHPASLAASLKRMGWWPEVKCFRQQPELVEEYFSDDTHMLNQEWPSRFLESMAHWRLTHKMLLQQARRYPDWIVITHERLSSQPLSSFQYLYDELDLPWTPRVARTVKRLTDHTNPTEARHDQAMDLSRNSADLFEMRRDSLSRKERQEIFDVVHDVALQLYSNESFALGGTEN